MVTNQDEFFKRIVDDEDIAWKTMIMESVKSGEMDPWDVDISYIATKFLEMLKNLSDMNFKVSGKVVLTSALLLKLKSRRFLEEDITHLDDLIASSHQPEYDEFSEEQSDGAFVDGKARFSLDGENFELHKRTPLARKRKVSVYDLIDALEQALEVSKRRQIRERVNAPEVIVPQNLFDISASMDELHKVVESHLSAKDMVSFSQLIPSHAREDKIMTFIPLLHLRNARKVDLHQDEHFTDFHVSKFDSRKELDDELK
jgi:chromatin segregation and condensation protein Rec8/ScpA/Scc1 (kleisin family)